MGATGTRRHRRGGGRRMAAPPAGRYSQINVRFLSEEAQAVRERARALGLSLAQLVEASLRATERMEFRGGAFVRRED